MSDYMASAKTGGWLQWKGTNVCIDLTCKKCGSDEHEDAEFLYFWQCSECKTWWRLEPYITLTEVRADGDFDTPSPFEIPNRVVAENVTIDYAAIRGLGGSSTP